MKCEQISGERNEMKRGIMVSMGLRERESSARGILTVVFGGTNRILIMLRFHSNSFGSPHFEAKRRNEKGSNRSEL
jgi:hypothetical protein